jgi:hypothetical protein
MLFFMARNSSISDCKTASVISRCIAAFCSSCYFWSAIPEADTLPAIWASATICSSCAFCNNNSAISNRIAEDFPDPDGFDPDRYEKPREEDVIHRWTWIPFGAGRHRCVGAAFATMQIKAIFSVLLREYDFEMVQPPESYRNDHSKMVVQLARPALVRYRKRTP